MVIVQAEKKKLGGDFTQSENGIKVNRREFLVHAAKFLAGCAVSPKFVWDLLCTPVNAEEAQVERFNVLGEMLTKKEIEQRGRKIFQPIAVQINSRKEEIARNNSQHEYLGNPFANILNSWEVVRAVDSALIEEYQKTNEAEEPERKLYLKSFLHGVRTEYLLPIKDIFTSKDQSSEVLKKVFDLELQLSNFFLSANFYFNKNFQEKGGDIFIELQEQNVDFTQLESFRAIFGTDFVKKHVPSEEVLYQIEQPDFSYFAMYTVQIRILKGWREKCCIIEDE